MEPKLTKAKYLLLDCDNTLVLSEALAFEACADLTNEILEKYGVKERYDKKKLLDEFVGQNFRGMINGLQKKHNFSMDSDELEGYVNMEVDRVIAKLNERATPCDGVPKMLERLAAAGVPMAVVSTSAKPRVVASMEKVGINYHFPDEHVFSAATTLDPPTSKPDPAIYLHACKVLGVKPEECVTVEDSKSGATAAKRANIPLIGYVGVYQIEDGDEKMKQMEKTLTEECNASVIMRHWDEFPEKFKEVQDKM